MIRRLRKILNFSFTTVDYDISVPVQQQMSVYQEQEIVDGSELDVEGEVVIYE